MAAYRRPQGPRHVSAASLDTNASGIAESTISLGLSRFPEPPSSIPSSPIHTKFDPSNRTTVKPSSTPSTSQSERNLTRPVRPSHPPTSINRFANSRLSFSPENTPPNTHEPSTTISPFDWHDGASSIDVDETEDRLLPTSFITSLLQENKQSRKGNRASFASEAPSGISEMTYPPPRSRPLHEYLQNGSSGSGAIRQYEPHPLQSDTQSSNRMSGDSETLHSVQGYPAIIRSTNLSRSIASPGMSVVGVAPATIRSISGSSQTSSLQDTDTIGSFTKGYQNKLSTTYESGEELLYDYQKFNTAYNTGPSPDSTQRRVSRGAHIDHLQRNSFHSQRSIAPSFISRISELSRRPFARWRTVKPLPLVPTIPNMSLATEQAYRKQEESTPLPELMNRAGALRDLLDRGQYPHHSISSYQDSVVNDATPHPQEATHGLMNQRYPGNTQSAQFSTPSYPQEKMSSHNTNMKPFWWKKKRVLIFLVLTLVACAVVGGAVGVSMSRKHTSAVTCSGNSAGSLCNLDATCVCTSSSGCNALSQNIVNILPSVNKFFNANFTPASAYSSIWMTQGGSTSGSCSSQAILVDTGSLDQAIYPSRARWAQAAMLWNVLMTQDLSSAQQMKSFVQALPWQKLDGTDGPTSAGSVFETTISGYTYNFASQSLNTPPASFVVLGQPSNAQISKVNSGTILTLDRMYSFAQASATQQQNALKKYWTTVLLRSLPDLATFKNALSVSPVLLPFNASSPQINNLYITSPLASFPPPLACRPQLSNSLLNQLNSFESTVFGLPFISSQTQFNPGCNKDRPIYGVLNVLRLRLPFLDSHINAARQSLVLDRDTLPRTILYNGPVFSSISDGTAASDVTLNNDPRHFGTPVLSDHVILRYLISMPTITIANAVVQFVLNTTTTPVPPDPSSLLYSSLNSIPTLEVAVFGDVLPTDITTTVSPLTSPSGTLFFGSLDGSALRNWTINSIKSPVLWTLNSTSPLIVRDSSLSPLTTISQTWTGAATAIALKNLTIDGPFILNVFQGNGDLSRQ